MPDYKYLVFAGGGSAGLAYAGAIEQLSKEPSFDFNNIEGVAGASVGALAALMIALNYTPDQASQKLGGLDLSSIADGGCVLSEGVHLLTKYGLYKGEALYNFIIDIIREKTRGIVPAVSPDKFTFGDLKKYGFKDLHVVATKIYEVNGSPTGKSKYFSPKSAADTPIAAIVHASAAGPFFFERVRLSKAAKGKYVLDSKGHMFSDGGLLDDFPIDIFDKPEYIPAAEKGDVVDVINPHTLGLALRTRSEISSQDSKPVKKRIGDNKPIKAFEGVATCLLNAFINEGLNKPNNIQRTIEIDMLGVSPFDFNLSNRKIAALKESGKQAVLEYFHPQQKEQKQARGMKI